MGFPNRPPVVRGVPRHASVRRRNAPLTGGPSRASQQCGPNWKNADPRTGADGCPESWNGCGEKVFASVIIPANQVGDLLITAPFEFSSWEAICSANTVEVDAAGVVTTTGPVIEGQVFLQQARTANSGTSIFGADDQAGVDLTFFYRDSFFNREVNFPVFANQPPGIRQFRNRAVFGGVASAVEIFWTEIGVSAHMLPNSVS